MATLADVARHAGVAASTVSYVLSGKRPVSEETRERVARSIELLGYQPHAGARALASAKSNVLALVMPLRKDLYVPVMMEIAIGVVTKARGYGYDVLLLTNDEGSEGIRRVASSPSSSGIRMSIRITSGLVSWAWRIASWPVSASATTSMSPSASRITRKPVRTRVWSSASRTRILADIPQLCRPGR